MNDWVLTGLDTSPCPLRPSWSASDARLARFDRLVDLWQSFGRTYTGDGGGDFEDWVEALCRIDAGVSVLGAERCWISGMISPGLFTNAASGVSVPAVPGARWWGPVARFDQRPEGCDWQATAASRYATSPVFARFAGRSVVTVDDSGLDHATAVAAAAAQSGRAWVKVNRPKYGIVRLEVGQRWSEVEELLLAAAHLEGEPDAFVVYPDVSMEFETRFFVVDGRPVTGAGCVESLTPLDGEARFDPKMERIRGDGAIVSRPDVMADHRAFAEVVAGRFAADGVRFCSLDIATGADGPLVVEFNSLLNSGLYASEPAAVIAALDRCR